MKELDLHKTGHCFGVCDNKRHLIVYPYSLRNLHMIALHFGIKRHWFHRDHYDIPKRRIAEITAKCHKVSSKDIVKIIKGDLEINLFKP